MSSCFDCGSPVTPEDRFCGNCGLALQPAAGAEGRAASSSSSALLAQEGGAGEPAETREPESSGYGDEQFQPTIIEPSRGGQAAAAARASAPVEPSEAPESSNPSESKGLSTAGSAELTLAAADDVEITADTSDEPPTGTVNGGQPPADESAPEWEPKPQNTGGASSAPAVGRSTGDLPSRPMAFTGRTGGGSSSSSGRRAASQLEPGIILYSRYEIVKRIGGGGMGAVYYAKDRTRRRPARRQGDDSDAPRRVAAGEGRRRLPPRVDALGLARTPFDPDRLRLLLRRRGLALLPRHEVHLGWRLPRAPA